MKRLVTRINTFDKKLYLQSLTCKYNPFMIIFSSSIQSPHYLLVPQRLLSNQNNNSGKKDSIDEKFNKSKKSEDFKESKEENKDDDISLTAVTKKAANSLGSATLHYTYEFNRLYHDLEKNLASKINKENRRRIIIFTLVSLIIFGIVFLLFGGKIRKKISDETAGLAKETLENESLKIQTQELAMAVVQTILSDKDISSQAAGFLREASSAAETQQALLQLTIHVLQHPESLHEVTILTKKLLHNISRDNEAIGKLAIFLSEALKDPMIKQVLVSVISDLARDPAVLEAVTGLCLSVLSKPEVSQVVYKILSEASQEVLKNDQVILQSRDFIADVMGDDKVQREGGDALWNSISHALTPGLRRFGGLTLVAASIIVIQIFSSPF